MPLYAPPAAAGGAAVDVQTFAPIPGASTDTLAVTARAVGLRSTSSGTAAGDTAAFTPAPDGLLMLFVSPNSGPSIPRLSAVTGHGLTWTERAYRMIDSEWAISLWTAPVSAGTQSSGVITMTLTSPGGTQQIPYSVLQVQGIDVTDPVRQPTFVHASGTTLTGALPAPPLRPPGARPLVAVFSTHPVTHRAGWTELNQYDYTDGQYGHVETQWRADTWESTYSATVSSYRTASLAVELMPTGTDPVTTHTWTKPDGATFVHVRAIGAGAGGGAGNPGATNDPRMGGGGGGGGGVAERLFRADELDATELVTTGSGGTGGAGMTSASTLNGRPGTPGGGSFFKSPEHLGVTTAQPGLGAVTPYTHTPYTQGLASGGQYTSLVAHPDGERVFISDAQNHRIYQVSLVSGAATAVAGSGTSGSADGIGTAATFTNPRGLALDPVANCLYVADYGSHKIRRIDLDTAAVSTVAGSGSQGSTNSTGTSASFNNPHGLALDPAGLVLYVTDTGSNKIRAVRLPNGEVTPVVGSGTAGETNGTGTGATIGGLSGIAINPNGRELYFINTFSAQLIKKVTIGDGVATTSNLAGGTAGNTDAIGTNAKFNNPRGLAIDSTGTCLYLADTSNNRIKAIHIATGHAVTLAGTSSGTVDGVRGSASFNGPWGVCVDAFSAPAGAGNTASTGTGGVTGTAFSLIVGDGSTNNGLVRRVFLAPQAVGGQPIEARGGGPGGPGTAASTVFPAAVGLPARADGGASGGGVGGGMAANQTGWVAGAAGGPRGTATGGAGGASTGAAGAAGAAGSGSKPGTGGGGGASRADGFGNAGNGGAGGAPGGGGGGGGAGGSTSSSGSGGDGAAGLVVVTAW